MNNHKTIRVILSLLLTVILINPYIAKDIHILQSEYLEHSCQHVDDSCIPHKHDCKSCQICQFTLSFFTETEPIAIQAVTSAYCLDIASSYNEKGYTTSHNLNDLRGPPTV